MTTAAEMIVHQVPVSEIGSNSFQEVDNDLLFRDVAEFTATVTSTSQLPQLLEQAVNAALAGPGVAVLTPPGDVGGQALLEGTRASLRRAGPHDRARTGRARRSG